MSCKPLNEPCKTSKLTSALTFLKASGRVNKWLRREWLLVFAACFSVHLACNHLPINTSMQPHKFFRHWSTCIVISHHDQKNDTQPGPFSSSSGLWEQD